MQILKKFFCLFLCLAIKSVTAYNVTCSNDFTYYYDCGIVIITPVTSPNEEANFVNRPPDFTDYSTTLVHFNQNFVLNYIPTNLFYKLLNISEFKVNGSSITMLTTGAFVNCKNLKVINLQFNNFSHVPASFAEQCSSVQTLFMQDNQISTVHEDVLKGLFELENLFFSRNKIQCIPQHFFRDNKKLVQINFGLNQIKALHSLLFKDMPKLIFVRFVGNKISYLPDFDLYNTSTSAVSTSRFSMNFDMNPIMAIHPLLITHMYTNNTRFVTGEHSISMYPHDANITTCLGAFQLGTPDVGYYYVGYLDWKLYDPAYSTRTTCYSNFTPEMADDSLVTCGNITTTTTTTTTPSSGNVTIPLASCSSHKICRYYLDYLNRYTCVIDGVDGVMSSISGTHTSLFTDDSVERVYFVNSNLHRIPNALFDKFLNLNFLYVRNCGISIINNQTFNKCGNLKFLDASFNEIIHIEETSLRNCSKLQTMDLTGNPLDFFSTQLYVYDPSLKNVHFHRNSDFTLN